MAARKSITLSIADRDVVISNPDKVYFPQLGVTKLQIVEYYLSLGEPVLRAVRARPMILKRFVNGIEGEAFFQKRAPEKRPDWVDVARFEYPSGLHADEVCVTHAATLAWIVNLGCVELHVHPVRMDDMDHPDELRIDLDPTENMTFAHVLQVAATARDVLRDFGMTGYPKTSGSRGVHVWVRIQRKWPFEDVRRAALALAREVERRLPDVATSTWQKDARLGVLVDYNQNARDRTTAGSYSLRPTPDARVSMPLTWEQLATCDPKTYTIATVPALLAKQGDAHAQIDDVAHSLDALLELSDKQEPRKPRNAKAKQPVIMIGRAKHKPDALAGLERWKLKHPDVVALLKPGDVIVDSMRGRSSAWYRVRVNLRNVPEEMRPKEVEPDPDFDITTEAPKWPP